MGNGQPRRHSGTRGVRVAVLTIASLGGLLALGVGLAPIVIEGPRFGRLIERNLPALRGKVQVGGGSWTWKDAWTLWRGRPAPFALDDVRLIDPDGTEVFRARRLTGEVEVSAHPWRVDIHHLQVVDATWRFARMRSRSDIGFLAALSPPASGTARPPGRTTPPGPGGAPRPGPTFRLFEAHLVGLNATFAFPAWELSLRDVHAAGDLAFDGTRGARPAFVFEVRGGDVRGGGELAVFHRATRFALPFERAWLNRVATTATAPDALLLEAAPVTAAGARLTFAGRFTGVLGNGGPSSPPGIEATIRGQQAAPPVQRLLSSLMRPAPVLSGRNATFVLRLSGRFAALTMDVQADAFDVRRGPIDLRSVGLRAWGQPAARRVRLDALTAGSPGGGQVSLTGILDRGNASGLVTFDRFSASEFLPHSLRLLAAGTLDGTVSGGIDLPSPHPPRAFIEELALVLKRPPGSPGPRLLRFGTAPRRRTTRRHPAAPQRPPPASAGASAVAGGTAARSDAAVIVLPRITAPAWGGAVSAGGTLVWGAVPRLDVTVTARRISAAQLLGSTFVTGPVSFRAHARGTLERLAVRVHSGADAWLTLFGAQFRLPPLFSFDIERGRLSLPRLRLAGRQGGALTVSGQVDTGGMELVVAVDAFPLARLPGFAETTWPVDGRLTGQLRISRASRISGDGSARPWTADGALSLQGTTFQGRPVGEGALSITAAPGGAMRARGQVIAGVTLDGTLTPGPGGVSGEATLQLREVRLEPFLAALPAMRTAAGLVSGTATARIAPGVPVLVEARLNKLALTRGRVDLHATSEVMIAARGDGWFRLRPARFVGSAGAVELRGEGEPPARRATGGGANRVGAHPAGAQLAELAIDAAGALDLRALQGLVAPHVRDATGLARVTAHLGGTTSTPTLTARLGLAGIAFTMPAVSPNRIRIAAGQLEIDEQTVRLRGLDVRMDPRTRIIVGGRPGEPTAHRPASRADARNPPERDPAAIIRFEPFRPLSLVYLDVPVEGEGVRVATSTALVEEARLAVRLRGDPRQALQLLGSVDLAKARFWSRPRAPAPDPGSRGAPPKLPAWVADPRIQQMQLDLRVRSRGGAITLEVPFAPDVRVDVDHQIRGTPNRPQLSGDIRAAGGYSSFALLLYRLFK